MVNNWVYLGLPFLKMVIFHGYVKPEGNIYIIGMSYGRIGMNDQSSTGFFGDVQRYSHIQDDPGWLYIWVN